MTEDPRPIRADDTVGHSVEPDLAEAGTAEGDTDTEGHSTSFGTTEDVEDVVGHVQPPRDYGR